MPNYIISVDEKRLEKMPLAGVQDWYAQALISAFPEKIVPAVMVDISRSLRSGYRIRADFIGNLETDKPLDDYAMYQIQCTSVRHGLPVRIKETEVL